MATIEQRLQALEGREAIRSLIASYGPMADAGDAAGVAGLWHENGSYGVGAMGLVQGRGAIAGLIQGPIHQDLIAGGCAHLLGPVAITLEGDHATARGHSIVLRHADGRFEVFRVSANRWDLARGGDAWHVVHRENALLDGAEAARALLAINPPSARHP